ncbi:MAG: calcium/sodium antiporter [Acidobacteria bacterium]|nr:calcium/sodium antiporter [Acidobacteriota bacterium]
MILPVASIILSLILLVWSAERFVDGSAFAARILGVPPLIIGMAIVGFGTSIPEMLVSAMAAIQNAPEIALGNAYGSNITNIALILGLSALINPIIVSSKAIKKELPLLLAVTLLAWALLLDETITRLDSVIFIITFFILLSWTVLEGTRRKKDTFAGEIKQEFEKDAMTLRTATWRIITGLFFLVISSRGLIWGAVSIARYIGISDLVIGLTIVAVGTSLPELASSVVAARKGEHDIALGNIIGSNIFNTLFVVGLAGLIRPMPVASDILARDLPIMAGVTLLLFITCFGIRRQGRINRYEGLLLLSFYTVYTIYLII